MGKKKGTYLEMVSKEMEGKKFDVHWIVEDPVVNDNGFTSDPVLRQCWMTPGTLKPFVKGSTITFDFDITRTFNKKLNAMADKVKVCDISLAKPSQEKNIF